MGSDRVPDQMNAMLDVLRHRFGHKQFREGQAEVILALLQGRSALSIFPTGGGKSICYQLPALLLEGTTLVISPLIALMKDQVEALQAKGIAAERLDSSLSAAEQEVVYEKLGKGQIKLLYVAPERLLSGRFLDRMASIRVAMLAVDEAHCISEWGNNFRPDYLRLAALAKVRKWHPVLALTATATPLVAQDIVEMFEIAENDRVQTSFRRKNLSYHITPCADGQKLSLLKQRLAAPTDLPAVVYVTLQQTAEMVATQLARDGFLAKAYHAGLPDEYRAEVQEQFMMGKVDIIVATIAFGMGIDKADVRAVYHYNLPKSLENYQQETGRAGRDGLPARCEMLACLDDLQVLRNFVYGDTPSPVALRQLVDHLLRRGEEFELNRYELSTVLDIRPLVLETVLTYLELDGVIQSIGTHHACYQIHFTHGEERLLSGHSAAQRNFLKKCFDSGKRGYRWLTIDLETVMQATGAKRERVVKELQMLEEAGEATLKPSGLRHRYRLGHNSKTPAASPSSLTNRLQVLFASLETAGVQRLDQVVALAQHRACLTRHLLQHFGETMKEDCGQCSSCLEANLQPSNGHLLPPRELPQKPVGLITADQVQMIQDVLAEKHAALRSPRQLARFLCGLKSPASSRARLDRHDAFAMLEGYSFESVLAQTETMLPS